MGLLGGGKIIDMYVDSAEMRVKEAAIERSHALEEPSEHEDRQINQQYYTDGDHNAELITI
jgi:hypothetical protein